MNAQRRRDGSPLRLEIRHPCERHAAILGRPPDVVDGSARFESAVRRWLDAAADGDAQMTHPSCRPCAGDALGTARVMEFQVLTGQRRRMWASDHRPRLRPPLGTARA